MLMLAMMNLLSPFPLSAILLQLLLLLFSSRPSPSVCSPLTAETNEATDPGQKSALPLANNLAVFNSTQWSSYRPNLYFGLKNRRPDSPLFGLMWYRQEGSNRSQQVAIRHWAKHEDNVVFMWNQHDGHSFGSQKIVDGDLGLRTDWLNFGAASWMARLYLQRPAEWPQAQAVVLYLALQDTETSLKVLANHGRSRTRGDVPEGWTTILRGQNAVAVPGGRFSLKIRPISGQQHWSAVSTLALREKPLPDIAKARDLVKAGLRPQLDGNLAFDRLSQQEVKSPNFVALQIDIKEDSALEILLQSEQDGKAPDDFAEVFSVREDSFRKNFNRSFPISNDFPAIYHKMGHAALSNLLGGIGVWHGNCWMHSRRFETPEVVKPYGPLSLISAVPSRTNFSRGFIWDEGFHNLLIYKWNPGLSVQIISAYLDLMNVDGWIPREVVLGSEAEARIPKRFLVQADWVANPPMFFYWMREFIGHPKLLDQFGPELARMYPRMKQLYLWFRQSQRGPKPGTFRWHDRQADSELYLNPSTLASGFDDYPRASHPSDDEYHLDLRCWMAMSSSVLAGLAQLAGDWSFAEKMGKEAAALADPEHLDQLHWSERRQQFCDFGLHSESVQLIQLNGSRGNGEESGQFVRHVLEQPRLGFVEDVNGYANLFPLLLKLLPASSPRLGPLLRQMADPRHFWTPFGLRSLSTLSPYYYARNSLEEFPYWRGPIWINMNYFAISALRHYSMLDGPHLERCARMHEELRENLLANVAKEYEATGFLWEYYNDQDGLGHGNHPFTGWTALILSILSDSY